ncbi:MAG: hypothetical protein QF479_07730 [Candidatus Poseidoniaceae archaeon]|nr:hypothetical protein [Candidatus Poseidoniaceae archaeon]
MQKALKQIESQAESYIQKHQKQRDEWNAKVVENRSRRDQINGQKRELYDEIERQRTVRDKENTRAREAKVERKNANEKYFALREELFGPEVNDRNRGKKGDSPEFIKKKMNNLEMAHMTGQIKDAKFSEQMKSLSRKLKDLEAAKKVKSVSGDNAELDRLYEAKEAAHKEVIESADAAQAAHDLMGKLRDETKRMNSEHEMAHRAFIAAKTEADEEHQHYIVAMRSAYSARHLMKAAQDRADGIQPSKADAIPQNVDLMSALMSGQQLSTEQIMAMQRKD